MDVHAALTRLHVWKAVRPGSPLLQVDTDALEELNFTKRVPTLIGVGITLSRRGRQALELPLMPHGEAVISSALYVQDAGEALARAGYTNLRPGRKSFYVVTGPNGRAYPLIGRVMMGGYSARRIRDQLKALEPDLLARGVKLVLVHPTGPVIDHPRLHAVHVPPQWPESDPPRPPS